jgi:hypothetical protein
MPVKKLNRKIETEKETKKRNRRRKKRSIRSILTRAAMYIQSACSFPQFSAGFQKVHTQIPQRKKNQENLNSTLIHVYSSFAQPAAASSTRSRPNRQTDTTLCSIPMKTNFTRRSKAGPQGSQMFVQTTQPIQGLRRDLLQVVRIICQKNEANTTNLSIVIFNVFFILFMDIILFFLYPTVIYGHNKKMPQGPNIGIIILLLDIQRQQRK